MDRGLALCIDIGTTNLKAGVVDKEGNVLSLYRCEIPLFKGDDGKAEHDPEVLFSTFVNAAKEVAKGYEDAISLVIPSTYMFGLVPVDENLEPLMGIMTLLDTRSKETYEELLNDIDVNEMYKRTGFAPTFHAPLFKIYWLKRKRKDIFEKSKYFLSSKDYIISKLLNKPYTEPSISSATGLMNINTLKWDSYSLGALGIDEDRLPEIVPSDEILAELPQKSKELLGLKGDVKLLPGVYDGGAVGIGIGAFEEGVGAINIGTTGMFRVAYPEAILDKKDSMRLQTYYLSSGKWFVGAAINNAGIILRWLRDNIFNISYDELTNEALNVDTSNLFFLPYITGERDKEIGNIASGVYFGLKNSHTKGHLIKAGLEGVAYSLRMLFEAVKDNNINIKEIRAGGGGTNSELWMEIFSSVLGLPIKVSNVEEPELLGSALLGFCALGVYKDVLEATYKMAKIKKVFMPQEEKVQQYEKGFQFFKLMTKDLKNLFEVHNKL
ncbi:MAG: gluconokinase [Thermoanaerobacterium sp.]|nr:gluconokinase [Thermoanaerobacterium sp.]